MADQESLRTTISQLWEDVGRLAFSFRFAKPHRCRTLFAYRQFLQLGDPASDTMSLIPVPAPARHTGLGTFLRAL